MRQLGLPRPVTRTVAAVGAVPLALILAVAFSAASWYFVRTMGLMGVLLFAGGTAGAMVVGILLLRFPLAVCMMWFVAMSGMRLVGLIRMPGLPDFSITRLMMILTMLLGGVALVSGKRIFRPPYGPEIVLVLHAVYVFLNMSMFGVDARFNTWLGSSFAPVVGFMFAKTFVLEERHLRAIMVTFVLVSVYFWITCVGEKFNISAIVWPKIILDRDVGFSWFGRSRGPFLQPAITGLVLGWYMMAQVYLLTRRLSTTVKTLLVINIALCGVATFLTYTRGPWLAAACGFLAMAALRPNYRKFLAVAAVAGALMVAADSLRPATDEFLGERLSNTSTIENRLGFLAAATRMIHDKPLFGIGYFRYLDLLPEYNRGTYIPFYGFVARGAGEAVPIHDMYIGRAAEEGLLSLALFGAFLAVMWRWFWKRWHAATLPFWFDRDFLAFYAGVMVAYYVNGMTLDYRYFDYVNVLPMFLSGIVVGFPALGLVGEQARGNTDRFTAVIPGGGRVA